MALKVSDITFNYEVTKISSLKEIYTPEVTLQGVPWRINIIKSESNGEPTVSTMGIFLHCENKSDSLVERSFPASATVTLLSFDEKVMPKVYHIPPYVYGKSGSNHGTLDFIEWSRLANGSCSFVKDDAINLNIHIHVADPVDQNQSVLYLEELDKCCNQSDHASFGLTITRIDDLLAVRTQSFILHDLLWNLTVFKNHSKHLGIRLECIGQPNDITCNVKLSLKLISSFERVDAKDDVRKQQIGREGSMCVNRFITWNELMSDQNGFVINGTIQLKINLKVGKPEGDVVSFKKRRLQDEAASIKMECSICLESILQQEVSSLACSHLFCSNCIHQFVARNKFCPICKMPAKLTDLRRTRLPM